MATVQAIKVEVPQGARVAAGEVRRPNRQVWQRENAGQIKIMADIPPGELIEAKCVCFAAPAWCPCLASCLCCGLPNYIKDSYQDSKFVYLTENGLLFNEPMIVNRYESCGGYCFGNCCYLKIADNVSYIPWDSYVMKDVFSITPCCFKCTEFCCGSDGAPIAVAPTCCRGCCYFSQPLPQMGIICCPKMCFGNALTRRLGCIMMRELKVKYEIRQQAIDMIKAARDNAKSQMEFQPY